MQRIENTSKDYITLESIAERKATIKMQLEESRKIIQVRASKVFGTDSTQGNNSFMGHIGTGIAIFDGVMTGLRIMRKVRSLFSFRRRY